MRVLILANLDMGLYKFRRELLESLANQHEVFFCVPEGEFVDKIKAIGCSYIPCKVMNRRSTNPVRDIKLLRFYLKVISDIKPQVVLTYTIKPNAYGGMACRIAHIPYIANVTGLGTAIANGGILTAISVKLYKIGLKKAQCVFFQNLNNQKYFLNKGIVKGKVKTIPGSGVNLDAHMYQPYPTDNDGIRFLFVGRIMKDKGIGELLSAACSVHRDRNDVSVDIVGWNDEDYVAAMKEAEKQGAVRYHGLQDDVHPFYANCHCVVLPSYHEGTANVILEASSTGRPIITTRVPGCQETFDEGVTGFGCEAKDPESLEKAMRHFLELSQKTRETMGRAARAKMEREYDRSWVVRAYTEEIDQIVCEQQTEGSAVNC